MSPSDTDQSLEALLNRIGVFSTTVMLWDQRLAVPVRESEWVLE